MPTFHPATFEKDDLAKCQGKTFITQSRWAEQLELREGRVPHGPWPHTRVDQPVPFFSRYR
jgi:hypothetical protein